MLTAIVATPLLLRWLGQERFGAFKVASDWAAYLLFLELGISGALPPLLGKALNDGPEATNRFLARGFASYRMAFLQMAVGNAVLIGVIGLLVPTSPTVLHEIRLGLIANFVTLATVLVSPSRWLLEASQKSYLVVAALIFQAFVITFSSVLLAYFGWGVVGQFASVMFGAVAFSGTAFVLAAKRQPGLLRLLRSRGGPADQAVELKRLSRPAMITGLFGRLNFMADNIIVAYFCGATGVVPFFLTQRLIQVAQGQLVNVGSATWASLAALYHQNNFDQCERRLAQLTNVCLVAAGACLLPLLAFNYAFIACWVGTQHFGGQAVTALAIIIAAMRAISSLWGNMLSGVGKIDAALPLNVVAALTNLTVSIVATYWFGLAGPLIGSAVTFLFVYSWWQPLLLNKHLGLRPARRLTEIWKTLLVQIVFATALYLIGLPQRSDFGWMTIILGSCAISAFYMVIVWGFALSASERTTLLAIVRRRV